MNRRDVLGAATALTAGAWPTWGMAQAKYPERAVRLVIPFAPGGQTDILGRRVAQRLEGLLGQTFVPDNRGGAGGTIGSGEVARAKPDGYSLLIGTSSTHSISPVAMDKAPYDPIKDFTPIALLGLIPMVIVVHPSVPAQNLKELVALIKSHPGKYAYGSAGMGSINHLTGEMFKARAGGLQLEHVPYKGSGASVQDLLGNQVPMVTATLSSVQAYARSGRVRILAVTSEARNKSDPEVPTAIEAGIPGMVSYTYNVLFGPAGLPKNVVTTLANNCRTMMLDGAFLKELEGLGIDPVTDSTPEKTNQFVKAELGRFLPIIKATGTKVQ